MSGYNARDCSNFEQDLAFSSMMDNLFFYI